MRYSKILIFISLILIGLSFFYTISYVANNERSDLWCNAIGSRILIEKQESPYFFKWNNETNERYVDPTDDNMHPTSRVTFTPVFALLFYPIASMEMYYMKWVFYIFNIFILLYILYTTFDLQKTKIQNSHLFLFVSIFIFNSSAWIMHCAEGQKYLIFSLIILLIYKLYLSKNLISCGFLIILLISMRLNSIIASLFFLYILEKRERLDFLKGMIFGFPIILLINVLFFDISIWSDYFKAMHLWSIYGLNEMPIQSEYLKNPIYRDVKGIIYPFDYALRHNNSGIQRWIYKILNIKVYKEFLFSCYIIVAASIIYFIDRLKFRKADTEIIFLQFFLIYILSEYFVPASRLPYYFVQWFFPILLVFNRINLGKNLLSMLFLTGLALNTFFLSFVPYGQIIGELFLIASLILFLYQQSNHYSQKNPIMSEI